MDLTTDERSSDSALILDRPTRPGSFTALMSLYESNHVRLAWLVDDIARLSGEYRSVVPGDAPLVLRVVEHHRYTNELNLTYLFEEQGEQIADPDLAIRVYHDARLAEAMSCHNSHRHRALRGFDTDAGSELRRRWMRNVMLNKWLEYCADLGHRFAPGDGRQEPQTD